MPDLPAAAITLRPYRAQDDLEPLVALWHRASLQAHAFLGAARLASQKDQIARLWLPAAETHVAVIQDRPVGFISLLDHVVGGLFVDPDQQGRGMGARLVAHALSLRGHLELDVYEDNPQARGFYQALGFQAVGRSPRDREGLPFAIIRLALSQP